MNQGAAVLTKCDQIKRTKHAYILMVIDRLSNGSNRLEASPLSYHTFFDIGAEQKNLEEDGQRT